MSHGDHGNGGHHHHHHGLRESAASAGNRRPLQFALALALLFLVVEVVGGIAYNSLALLSDAAHMLTDAGAYALALLAIYMAGRAPTMRRTYGFARAEIVAALVNGATLIAASGWIVVEAVQRMLRPEDVAGTGVMAVAVVGLLANAAIVWALLRGDRQNLNMRGALLHGITDALSSLLVLVTGAIVAVTGFDRADSIASLLISALVVWGSWRLVREAIDILLDAVPAGIDVTQVADALLAVPAVSEVHDLHAWTLGPGTRSLSAHVRVDAAADRDATLAALTGVLEERFGIGHSTLQLTADRALAPLDAVERLPLHDAVEWATDHIAFAHPNLARSVISAATGAAALECSPHERVSPVAISVRAMAMLTSRTPAADRPLGDDHC